MVSYASANDIAIDVDISGIMNLLQITALCSNKTLVLDNKIIKNSTSQQLDSRGINYTHIHRVMNTKPNWVIKPINFIVDATNQQC